LVKVRIERLADWIRTDERGGRLADPEAEHRLRLSHLVTPEVLADTRRKNDSASRPSSPRLDEAQAALDALDGSVDPDLSGFQLDVLPRDAERLATPRPECRGEKHCHF
jgi:hypothetical protein